MSFVIGLGTIVFLAKKHEQEQANCRFGGRSIDCDNKLTVKAKAEMPLFETECFFLLAACTARGRSRSQSK